MPIKGTEKQQFEDKYLDNIILSKQNLLKFIFAPKGNDFWLTFRKDIYNKEDLNNLGLNERQVDALLFFKDKGEIISSEYAKKYNVSDRTARRDLSELTEMKLLKNEGDNKLSKYIFS